MEMFDFDSEFIKLRNEFSEDQYLKRLVRSLFTQIKNHSKNKE
jgi:hypothetical protein